MLAHLSFIALALGLSSADPVGVQPCACPTQQIYLTGGVIKSPGYSSNRYCGPLKCTYKLIADANTHVRLNFLQFSTNEKFDNLTIYDGPKADDPENQIGIVSGTATPTTTLYSGLQQMTLVFQTDLGGNTGRWAIQWMSDSSDICGTTTHFSSTTVSFQTPNYPYNYPDNVDCTWSYTASSGKLASVAFAPGADTEPCCDQVVVQDGSDKRTYRGAANKQTGNFATVFGSTNTMTVRFTSDASVVSTGFRATFSSYSPPPNCTCGPSVIQLNKPTDTTSVTSPNYGPGQNGYCRNANCHTVLIAPDGYKPSLHFNSFDLEAGFDHLYVEADVNGATLKDCTGRSCNGTTVVSPTQYMTLLFRTDGSVSRDGYSAVLSAV